MTTNRAKQALSERKSSDRFLEALDPSDPVVGVTAAGAMERAAGWPSAVGREAFAFGYPVEPQWLDDERIGGYLADLRRQAGAAPDCVPAMCELPRDWRAATHPLLLCEYLAYKAALVYREPKAIRDDLLGKSRRDGRRFSEGIAAATFFDSAPRRGSVRRGRVDGDHAGNFNPRTFVRPASVRYGDTQAVAFVAHRTGYVVLRGTESFDDLATNLNDELTDRTYPELATVPQSLVGAPRPARRTGYAIAWGAIAPDIEAWVREQVRDGRIDRVVFSGHSLGGSLAILAGWHFARNRICPVHAVITFGAPKVGGEEFRRAYENPALGLKDRTLRLEAADDLITILDRRWDGLVHVGHGWRFKRRPLRPWWQMVLWAPLIEPEVAAEKALRKARKRGEKNSAGANSGDGPVRERGRNDHNLPPEVLQQNTFAGIVLALSLKLSWQLFGRLLRAWTAHSVENHYGIYLSTLSYRKIRAHHEDLARLRLMTRRSFERENILLERAYRAANEDLARHLAFIRGRHPKTFRSIFWRPIRVNSPEQVARTQKQFTNYVC